MPIGAINTLPVLDTSRVAKELRRSSFTSESTLFKEFLVNEKLLNLVFSSVATTIFYLLERVPANSMRQPGKR
jgi:hypothetical protein